MSTGCAGLDEILYGGLPTARSYLLIGAAGTGKTILSLQWQREGVRRGESCIYLSLMEPTTQITRDVEGLGWSLEGIRMVDLSPRGVVMDVNAGEEYRMFAPSEVERANVWKGIYEAIDAARPQRVVIDSLTQLRYLSTDHFQFRRHILQLVAFLNERGCTTLLLFEPTEAQSERSVELAVDGVLRLRFQISAALSLGVRSVDISKLRSSGFMSGYHAMRIGKEGVTIFPHRVERTAEDGMPRTRTSSGIPGLDDLLGGGLESGTATVLSGPAGVGKSTLGLLLMRRIPAGQRAAMLTFEESRDSVLERCRGIGMGDEIKAALASGTLQIKRVNPLELYPDELLAMVRDLVEVQGVRHFMLDGLRGYGFAMEEFGTPLAHVHNLLTYLGRMNVTTILIAETETITGDHLTATDTGASHLADNIVLMRYAEFEARIIKVIGCLKKRLGGFEPELRELLIGPQGVAVSAKLDRLRGILTGMPRIA
jgi:circadian clock protein KaiC